MVFFFSHPTYSQHHELSFKNEPIDQILLRLESQTEYAFNYDPSLLSAFTFSGTISTKITKEELKQLLYSSPFAYEINNKTVLIYQPDPILNKICGYIKDVLTSESLAYANIYADDTNSGVQSRDNGYFELDLVAHKNQAISISYIGYESKTFFLQELNVDSCPTIFLRTDSQLWKNDITITDYVLDGITEGESYNGYNMDYGQLSRNFSAVEHDILKTTQLIPGIISTDESATNLTIRGSTESQNLLMWEGAPLYQSGHLFGMISAINPFAVDKINIYKGSYDPQYDNRVGGLIDISLTDSINQSSSGSIGTTLTEAHLNVEQPLIKDKLAVILSGRLGTNPLIRTAPTRNYINRVIQASLIGDQAENLRQGGTVNTEQDLSFYDLKTKVLFRPHQRLFIKAGVFQNAQDFEYRYRFPDDPFRSEERISERAHVINTNMTWTATDTWTPTISILHSGYRNTTSLDEVELNMILRDYDALNEIYDRTYSFSNKFNISTDWSFQGGYDYNIKRSFFTIDNQHLDEPDFKLSEFTESHFHNVFASGNYTSEWITFNAGIRSTFFTNISQWFYAPRFSLQIALQDGLKLKTEGGVFHQFLSQINDFGQTDINVETPLWILSTAFDEYSQRSNKLSVGMLYVKNGWLVDWDLYHNYTTGLNTSSAQFNPIIWQEELTGGTSRAIGLDLLLKKRWEPFTMWLNYSLAHAQYSFPEKLEDAFDAPQDIRHIGNIVANYQYKRVQLSATGRFHSGLPYSEPTGISTTIDDVDNSTFYNLEYDEISNRRLRPYSRIDLGIHYRTPFVKKGKIRTELSLSVINVLGRENVFARGHYLDLEQASDIPPIAYLNLKLLERTPLLLLRMYW